MWHHQDRMSRVSDTYGETDTGSILARYEEVIRADSEIKALYVSWPEQLRDIDTIPSVHPSKDSLPAELMPAMLLMSTAQKVLSTSTYHRYPVTNSASGVYCPSPVSIIMLPRPAVCFLPSKSSSYSVPIYANTSKSFHALQ